jgi:hypothetical protein
MTEYHAAVGLAELDGWDVWKRRERKMRDDTGDRSGVHHAVEDVLEPGDRQRIGIHCQQDVDVSWREPEHVVGPCPIAFPCEARIRHPIDLHVTQVR